MISRQWMTLSAHRNPSFSLLTRHLVLRPFLFNSSLPPNHLRCRPNFTINTTTTPSSISPSTITASHYHNQVYHPPPPPQQQQNQSPYQQSQQLQNRPPRQSAGYYQFQQQSPHPQQQQQQQQHHHHHHLNQFYQQHQHHPSPAVDLFSNETSSSSPAALTPPLSTSSVPIPPPPPPMHPHPLVNVAISPTSENLPGSTAQNPILLNEVARYQPLSSLLKGSLFFSLNLVIVVAAIMILLGFDISNKDQHKKDNNNNNNNNDATTTTASDDPTKSKNMNKSFGNLFGMLKRTEQAQKSDKLFTDVLGCDEAKEELVEVVDFLRNPQKFTKFGGKLPKGVLLVGPPGTGKTLLAKAVAGEANVPFFYKTASEFDEMFVGVGSHRVRELFKTARQHAPCIIFVDEMDALGGKRAVSDRAYDRMTLNQFLAEMDGFNSSEGIVIIGATNYPEGLDNALKRAGRFDKIVSVDPPDVNGRTQILNHYLSKTKNADGVDASIVARGTPGFTGADLENLVNTAALRAAGLNRAGVTMEDLDFAKDKILMGAEKRSRKPSEHSRRLTAYHEGGHALVSMLTAGTDPIHKATIIPRGQAKGMVIELPEDDRSNYTYQQLLARLNVMMGGRAAEELIFGPQEITTGAYSDIKGATHLARRIVKDYGFSKLGPVSFSVDPSSQVRPSVETERLLDAEVKHYLDNAYDQAKQTLMQNQSKLHVIAAALLRYETLSGEELKAISDGKPIKGGEVFKPDPTKGHHNGVPEIVVPQSVASSQSSR